MFEMEIIALETANFTALCAFYEVDPEDASEKMHKTTS